MSEKFSMNLAVRKICRRRCIDISKYARSAGLSQSMLYQTMRKDTPNLSTLERCAAGFGMSLSDFIAEGYTGQRKDKAIILPAPCGAQVSSVDELSAVRAYAMAVGEATYMARAITAIRAAGYNVEATESPGMSK